MAQSLSYLATGTIPFPQSSTNLKSRCCEPKNVNFSGCPESRKPRLGASNGGNRGVKAMAAADRRDNLDHLQRTGIKRREAPSAPLGIWDRFPTARTIQQMMDTMDRLSEDPSSFNSTWSSPSPSPNNGGNGYVRGRTPWEIKEGQSEYKMRFDMPGMTKQDVKVWVEEKMLVIKAEKKVVAKRNDGQENGAVVEDEGEWPARSYGRYSCRIALPENVEFEKIKAEVKDGVLYVTVPKAKSTSKILDINVE